MRCSRARITTRASSRSGRRSRSRTAKAADESGGGKSDEKKSEGKKAEAIQPPRPDSIWISLAVPRARPAGTVAFTGARVLSMRGGDADAIHRRQRVMELAFNRHGDVVIAEQLDHAAHESRR